MRSLLFALTILSLSTLGIGCDKSGVHPLGVPRDLVTGATTPTTTWLRSTDTGTEILIIGINTLGTLPTQATTDMDGLVFGRGFVEQDSSTTLDLGTYTLDANGSGSFTYDKHYSFNYEPEKAILSRKGAVRTDLAPPTVESVSIAADAADQTLLVTMNGVEHRYTNLQNLVRSLDPDTDVGRTALYRIINFPLFLSQNRIVGFGGAGLTQYIRAPGVFAGMVDGQVTIRVESLASPTTHIVFKPVDDKHTVNFEDVTGVEIQGEQITYVNIQGEGHMGGVLDWTIYGDSRSEVLYHGTLDYADLQISNGLASGGEYGFAVDGHGSIRVPAATALDVFLDPAVLPILTP